MRAAAAYKRGDYHTAFREFMPLAVAGDPLAAQFNIGRMYARGEGVPQNYAEAVRWYRMAADQGNAHSAVQPRRDVLPRPGRTSELCRGGALVSHGRRPGRAEAQSNLGVMYVLGQGVPQNYAEAVRWFRLAAAQGNANAQFNLGVMYYVARAYLRTMPRPCAGIAWPPIRATRSAVQPWRDVRRGQGVAQNDAEAARWYRTAAAQGDAEAQAQSAV